MTKDDLQAERWTARDKLDELIDVLGLDDEQQRRLRLAINATYKADIDWLERAPKAGQAVSAILGLMPCFVHKRLRHPRG